MFLIGFFGFIVWVYYMFIVGMDVDIRVYFIVVIMIIVVLIGIKVFSWLVIIYGGVFWLDILMFWVMGFVFLFIIGGLIGVILVNSFFDIVLYDIYYVVVYFYYVFFMGVVFVIFGGFYYWIGKISGYCYNEFYGKIYFWLMFIGVNLIFFL